MSETLIVLGKNLKGLTSSFNRHSCLKRFYCSNHAIVLNKKKTSCLCNLQAYCLYMIIGSAVWEQLTHVFSHLTLPPNLLQFRVHINYKRYFTVNLAFRSVICYHQSFQFFFHYCAKMIILLTTGPVFILSKE